MTVATSTMVDTIHDNVDNIPPTGPYTHVGGYTSGTSDILWTASDWNRFRSPLIHIRIEQGYGTKTPDLSTFDVYDVETGAWTPQEAAAGGKSRVEAGYQWTTYYAGRADLETIGSILKGYGEEIWNGHHDCALADWTLSEAEAAALIGTEIGGMTVRWVQYASPTSNPTTLLPGTKSTLKGSNVDLGVVESAWRPTTVPGKPVTTPAPPTPAPVSEVRGIVVYGSALDTVSVTSTDNGKTWTA